MEKALYKCTTLLYFVLYKQSYHKICTTYSLIGYGLVAQTKLRRGFVILTTRVLHGRFKGQISKWLTYMSRVEAVHHLITALIEDYYN